jgi:hypothetical protein
VATLVLNVGVHALVVQPFCAYPKESYIELFKSIASVSFLFNTVDITFTIFLSILLWINATINCVFLVNILHWSTLHRGLSAHHFIKYNKSDLQLFCALYLEILHHFMVLQRELLYINMLCIIDKVYYKSNLLCFN